MIDWPPTSASRLSLVATIIFAAAVGWVVQIVIRRATHYFHLKHIAGPSFGSLFSRNFQETFNDRKATVINRWIDRYGKVFRTWVFFGDIELYVADLKGIGHVLKHDSVRYQKPEMVLFITKRLIGNGLFVIEGDAHRKQRKVMNPAFGPAEIRNLTGTFLEKSVELRDAWTAQLQKGDGSKVEIDVLHWLSRMTLDVIGQAGFNYQFNAVSGEHNPLNEAFSKVFSSGNFMTPSVILKLMFPPLRVLAPSFFVTLICPIIHEPRVFEELGPLLRLFDLASTFLWRVLQRSHSRFGSVAGGLEVAA